MRRQIERVWSHRRQVHFTGGEGQEFRSMQDGGRRDVGCGGLGDECGEGKDGLRGRRRECEKLAKWGVEG